MIVSTRGRYALRVLVDLAEQEQNGYTPMKEVAKRQGISLKYLEKILPVLVENRIIEGVHGKGGGYRLVRKPSEYRVGEILRLTEGNLAPVSCLECSAEACDRAEDCRTRPMWEGLEEVIKGYLDSVTISELMKKDQSRQDRSVIAN